MASKGGADKENVHRTRIPLPKDPLPALPKHLLVEMPENIPQRCPLKTLNTQTNPTAGPSTVVPHKPKHPFKRDMKYVTFRKKNNDLDWSDIVSKDERADKNTSVTILSSDDETCLEDKDSQRKLVEKRKKTTLGEALRVGTPTRTLACLEPNRVKNIKRSLKRPHSRELQSVSTPVTVNLHKHEVKVKRRLKFTEGLQDKLRTPDIWQTSYLRSLNRDYTSDVFGYLLAAECKPLLLPRTTSTMRACIINWLMKVNGPDGNPAIIQSACWYFDSILGTTYVSIENMQLVGAACFWIAQKLNGPYIAAMKLVMYSNNAFSLEQLLKAEKSIMLRLKFPKQPVVAQDYITYLCWWSGSHNAGEIELAATFLAMCGLLVDKAICDEYPSVIAIAAVRNALLLLGKKDLIPRLHMCYIFKAAEKKATNLAYICSMLRRSVRRVAASMYEYKAPLEHYSMLPYGIAQRIISAANEFSVMDTRNIDRT